MQLKDSSPGFDPGDLRRVRSRLGGMQTLAPVALQSKAFIGGPQGPLTWKVPLTWKRFRKSAAKGTRTSRNGPAPLQNVASELWYKNIKFAKQETDEIPIYPLLAYYGTGRLWDQNKLTFGRLYSNKADTSRESGYEDSLSPKSSYKSFVDWFGRYSNESKGEKDTAKPSPHKPSEKLQALTDAVDILLKPTGWHSLSWDFAEKRPVATHPDHGVLPVDFLSDGLRNTIGLTSDLAQRCARLNPQFGAEAARLTPGIVLIDEVDMHLHPEWQQLVLKAFMDAFPLIQFIVTTHSPQVLTTAKRENIRILSQDAAGTWTANMPDEETKAVESSTVMNDVMRVNQIPPGLEANWRNDYTALIENGTHESTDGRNLKDKLVGLYTAQHSIMLDFDRLIRFQAFKRKQPHRD